MCIIKTQWWSRVTRVYTVPNVYYQKYSGGTEQIWLSMNIFSNLKFPCQAKVNGAANQVKGNMYQQFHNQDQIAKKLSEIKENYICGQDFKEIFRALD